MLAFDPALACSRLASAEPGVAPTRDGEKTTDVAAQIVTGTGLAALLERSSASAGSSFPY